MAREAEGEFLLEAPAGPQLVFQLVSAALPPQGPPHKCALFFVDNSGVDIILGVVPFVRELLLRGTEVSL